MQNGKEEITSSDTKMENVWQSAHEEWHEHWKKNLTISIDGPGNVNKGNGLQPDIIHY